MGKDYYQILGVDRNALDEEIKKAFRKKAHEYHPDKAGGNAEKFKEINEAYQVLSKPERKKQYDQYGTTFEGFGGQAAYDAGFNWSDLFRQGSGGFRSGGVNFDFGDLGDIFSDFFGQQSRPAGQRAARVSRTANGHDLEINLTVDFNEAVFGIGKTLEIVKMVGCRHCLGNGAEPGTKIETCARCQGQGQISTTQQTFFGAFRSVSTCPDCQGEGKRASQNCSQCQGRGTLKDKVRLKVNIPAGIDDGETIRLAGEGEAGEKGGQAGDLYLNLSVRPSAEFRRQGYDIHTFQKISFSQASLGGKVKVKTVDGEVSLKIPIGTQNGRQFILKEKGVPRLRGRGRGNQLVTVEVLVPKDLNRQQKKLVQQLADEGL
ncbi:MAG TPA: molecular chaperone DnaJ [Candidatus Komeilibacteria bacterium]|nr:molecular chaperone DnaJ [Candidatus Komeilibacteria bacterium]